MCGQYEAGQKQKIAEAFRVSVMLEHIYFGAGCAAAGGTQWRGRGGGDWWRCRCDCIQLF
jgi:hypothetical protein